jgi:hypothetical protein
MLTQSEKANLLKDFPNVKLSYENIIYKKVHNSDYIVAIPEGVKCFAWFTSFNDKFVCLIMELTEGNQISDIKIANACFSNDLAYGTILYGTVVYQSSNRFFYIEDIFSYKGCDVAKTSWGDKLTKMNTMLKKDLKQVAYNNSFIVFGLPLLCKTNEELEKRMPTINYKINNIQFMLFKMYNKHISVPYKNYIEPIRTTSVGERFNSVSPPILKTPLTSEQQYREPQYREPQQNKPNIIRPSPKAEIVFLVRPEIQDDIYNIYCLNSGLKEEQHGIAHIPNFNTSVMMNKLFRNIKENHNLDALEESDDEDEFENDKSDKFVYLDRSYKMVCVYNPKFKKWTPIKLANEKSEIIKGFEIKNIYKIYDENKKKQFTKK